MFGKQVLESMGIEIKLPILIKVETVGAIYLSNNNFALSQRTKHIYIRQHFVFVPTDDNEADINTKNTMEAPFIRHTEKNLDDIKYHQVNNRKDVRTRNQYM
jgi:hypothetical protein